MTRVFLTLWLVGLAAAATGCGKGAMEGPVAPRHPGAQTEAPRRHERPLPHLIAPPPAYGNKVVMAKSAGKIALN